MAKTQTHQPSAGRDLRSSRRTVVTAVLCFAAWILWHFALPTHELDSGIQSGQKQSRGWSDIKPSSSLAFRSCFGGFECARLDVPLNWNGSSWERSHQRAAIAVTRLPAKVPVTDPRYGGAILINPGGPGGSGVSAVLRWGAGVQLLADAASSPQASSSDQDKFFDVIGFDPRGINNTEPHGACFPDDVSREIWQVRKQAQGIITNHSYPYVWGRSQAVSQSCTVRMDSDENRHVGRYMNTPVVVEDMVAIIEALGEWREEEARLRTSQLHTLERSAILERTAYRKSKEKILYWGFSYGTALGASFASMHPQRLHRFILDGVVDAVDYYKGLWSTNLQDTDKIMAKFFTECYVAGTQKCALASYPDAEAIFTSVLNDLEESPLSVAASTIGSYGPQLITYSDAMLYILRALYTPRKDFPKLASLIKSIHVGNGTEAAFLKQQTENDIGCRSDSCSRDPWSSKCHDPGKSVPEQGAGVACTDADSWLANSTEAFHWGKYNMLLRQSRYLGGYWAEITMACAGWHIRPAWEYTPPLRGNTSHPILWLANTRDPVTPLRNAVKMSKRFPGSRVLTLDAEGHCSLSAPSLCVAKKVRAYFQTGDLPKEGSICQPISGLFDGWVGESLTYDVRAGMSGEDSHLLQAVEMMHKAMRGGFDGPLGV